MGLPHQAIIDKWSWFCFGFISKELSPLFFCFNKNNTLTSLTAGRMVEGGESVTSFFNVLLNIPIYYQPHPQFGKIKELPPSIYCQPPDLIVPLKPLYLSRNFKPWKFWTNRKLAGLGPDPGVLKKCKSPNPIILVSPYSLDCNSFKSKSIGIIFNCNLVPRYIGDVPVLIGLYVFR